MDISSVEQYIGYTVASQIMKEALGDGMEYELVFQAVLEQMQNNNTSSGVSNEDVNNIISEKKEEIIIADIKKVAKGKEKEFKTTAQKYIDDINENKWMIKVDIIDQLKNYIDNY